MAAYDEALALKPDYAEALNNNRANALVEIGRGDEALAVFTRWCADAAGRSAKLVQSRLANAEAEPLYAEALPDFDKAAGAGAETLPKPGTIAAPPCAACAGPKKAWQL